MRESDRMMKLLVTHECERVAVRERVAVCERVAVRESDRMIKLSCCSRSHASLSISRRTCPPPQIHHRSYSILRMCFDLASHLLSTIDYILRSRAAPALHHGLYFVLCMCFDLAPHLPSTTDDILYYVCVCVYVCI